MKFSLIPILACMMCVTALAQTPPSKPKSATAPESGSPAAKRQPKPENTAAAKQPIERDHPGRTAAPASSPKRAPHQQQTGAGATPNLPAVDRLCALVVAADFDAEPLELVLGKLADASGANIVVKWDRLVAAGIPRDAPVTLHVKNVAFAELLRRLMEHVQKPDAKLAYRAARDLILFSTEEDFSSEMITKAYYVRDIIANDTRTPTLFVGRTVDVPVSVEPVVAQGAVAFQPVIQRYASGQIVQFPGSSTRTDPGEYDANKEIAHLIETIVGSVDPDSWDVNGGKGSIRAFRNMIIVRNTPFVHQQLGGPLTE